jgi:hypothetical protein
MFLRYFQKGEQLTADKLNSLVDAIRQSAIQSGPGYNVQQTPSGTTLSITPGTSAGSGGSTVADCVWSVSDTSEVNENGSIHMMLTVGCWEIEHTGKWPEGSSIIHPYKVLDLAGETEGWIGVYVEINLDQKNQILNQTAAVKIGFARTWRESNSVIQRTYLAGVTISNDASGNPYISYIDQYCPTPRITPAPTCPFLIEDWGMGETTDPQISIRSTTVERNYPTGMDDTNTYRLTIPNSQDWMAVYCIILTDAEGNIRAVENAVTLGLETQYRDSSQYVTYFLLGEVNCGYDADGNRVITHIYNACSGPFITGAVNPANGLVIPRGTSQACAAQVLDNTDAGVTKVKVSRFQVNNRYPQGMSITVEYLDVPTPSTGYIYCLMKYVANDVILKPEEDAIVLAFHPTIKTNTANEQYFLIATVIVENGAVTQIDNVCENPYPNPCLLKWN